MTPVQILIVDSHLDSIELMTIVFKSYGIETLVAKSVSEALKILKQAQPDLLISEIRLPDEDGYSLMRTVKVLEAQQQLVPMPAIALCAGEISCAHALSVGFSKHLSKPFDIEELLAIIASLISAEKTSELNKRSRNSFFSN
jgi:two-component system, OmpR family, response regulator